MIALPDQADRGGATSRGGSAKRLAERATLAIPLPVRNAPAIVPSSPIAQPRPDMRPIYLTPACHRGGGEWMWIYRRAW